MYHKWIIIITLILVERLRDVFITYIVILKNLCANFHEYSWILLRFRIIILQNKTLILVTVCFSVTHFRFPFFKYCLVDIKIYTQIVISKILANNESKSNMLSLMKSTKQKYEWKNETVCSCWLSCIYVFAKAICAIVSHVFNAFLDA